MSQITGLLSIQGLSSWVNQGVSEDVTPNAVDWCNLPISGELGVGYGGSQQITGISTSITLRVEIASNNHYLYYKLLDSVYDAGDGPGICTQDYNSFAGWTLLSNNDTFSVENNKHIGFRSASFLGGGSVIVTVRNISDGNNILDTFQLGPES